MSEVHTSHPNNLLPKKLNSLFAIIENGNKAELIRYWKKDKSLFKKKGVDDQNALHIASKVGNVQAVQFLLEKNKSSINTPMRNGFTPLHLASKEAQLKICEVLLRNKADPNLVTSSGCTPLHFFVSSTCSDAAGYHRVLQLFLSSGATTDCKDIDGETPLHKAALKGIEQAVVYLKSFGADINTPNKNGLHPIQLAARNRKIEVVGILIGMGANLSGLQKDYQDRILPSEIVQRYQEKLENGEENCSKSAYIQVGNKPEPKEPRKSKKVETTNKSGGGGSVAMKWGGSRQSYTEQQQLAILDQINYAIEQSIDLNKVLRRDFKTFINKVGSYGQSPIHVAAVEGNAEACEFLIDKFRADPNLFDQSGKSPLLLASKYGRLNVLETFLERPDLRIDAQAVSKGNSRTALHYLASFPIEDCKRVIKVVRGLVERGLDIHGKTRKQGFYACHYAARTGNAQTVHILNLIRSPILEPNQKGVTPLQLSASEGNLEVVKVLLEIRGNKDDLLAGIKEGAYGPDVLQVVDTFTRVHSNSPTSNQNRRSVLMKSFDFNALRTSEWSHPASHPKHSPTSKHPRKQSGPHSPSERSRSRPRERRASHGLPLRDSSQSERDTVHMDDSSSSSSLDHHDGEAISEEYSQELPPVIHQLRELLKSSHTQVGNFTGFLTTHLSGINCREELFEKHLQIDGKMAIHLATESNNLELVKHLIEKWFASVNSTDFSGNTCLHLAAKNANLFLCEYLLEYGANSALCNRDGQNFLHILAGVLPSSNPIIQQLQQQQLPQQRTSNSLGSFLINMSNQNLPSNPVPPSSLDDHSPSLTSLIDAELDETRMHLMSLSRKSSSGGDGGGSLIKSHHSGGGGGAKNKLTTSLKGNSSSHHHHHSHNGDSSSTTTTVGHSGNKGSLHQFQELTLVGKLSDLISRGIALGVDLSQRDAKGNQISHIAASVGNLDFLQAASEHHASLEDLNSRGFSPIQLAALYDHRSTIAFLKSRGVTIPAEFPSKSSSSGSGNEFPVTFSCAMKLLTSDSSVLLEPATRKNSKPKPGSRILKNAGASQLNAIISSSGVAPDSDSDSSDPHSTTLRGDPRKHIHSLTVTGNIKEIRKLLKKHGGKLLDSSDHEGSTPVHLAVLVRNLELLALFVEKRANPNIVNAKGYSPLLIAAKSGALSACELLLANGADPRITTPDGGLSALHFLVSRRFPELKEERLRMRVLKLLSERGADPLQKTRNGEIALHFACALDQSEVVGFLLSWHAINQDAVNIVSRSGDSALFIAARNGHTEIVEMLLDAGADPTFLSWEFALLSIPKSLETRLALREIPLAKLATASRAIVALENLKDQVNQLVHTHGLEKLALPLPFCGSLAPYLNVTDSDQQQNENPSALTFVGENSHPFTLSESVREDWKRLFGTFQKKGISVSENAISNMEVNLSSPASSSSNQNDESLSSEMSVRLTSQEFAKFAQALRIPLTDLELGLLSNHSSLFPISFEEFERVFGGVFWVFHQKPEALSKSRAAQNARLKRQMARRSCHFESKPTMLEDCHFSQLKLSKALPEELDLQVRRRYSAGINRDSLQNKLLDQPLEQPLPQKRGSRVTKGISGDLSASVAGPNFLLLHPISLSSSGSSVKRKRRPVQAPFQRGSKLATRPSLTLCSGVLDEFESVIVEDDFSSEDNDYDEDDDQDEEDDEYTDLHIETHQNSHEEDSFMLVNVAMRVFFEEMFDFLSDSQEILCVKKFEEAFSDSFTSQNLLSTIIPTLISQKSLEISGITRDGFCEFFCSQKQKSLHRILDQLCMVRDLVAKSLKDIPKNYQNFSSVERFRSRNYLHQILQLISSIQGNVNKTYIQLANSKIHLQRTPTAIDQMWEELFKTSNQSMEALAILSLPRKIKSIPTTSTDNGSKIQIHPPELDDQNHSSSSDYLFFSKREITAKNQSQVSSLRQQVDLYSLQVLQVEFCIKSVVQFSEPLVCTVIQTWKNSDALMDHLQSEQLKQFLEKIEPLKSGDTFSVDKIS